MNRFLRALWCAPFVFLAAFYSAPASAAQEREAAAEPPSRITLSGFVSDAENGERLIGATVYVPELGVGTATNAYGFYSLTLAAPGDSLVLRVSFVGFAPETLRLFPEGDLRLDVALAPEAAALEGEVVVVADRGEEALTSTQMSVASLTPAQVAAIPALLGESDVLKALQLMPGVQSGGEGSSGLYVRGGGPDQNLILLDGAPIYNASHIFGFFSVFNPDALQNVQLTKGGFPARFGGRLSSVVDIRMKDGNLKNYEVDGAVGLIFSKLTVQGPIVRDRASFIVSARRTYADVLARPFLNEDEVGQPVAYFGDLNAKLNVIASPRSRLFLSLYAGQDTFATDIVDEYEGGYFDEPTQRYVDTRVRERNTGQLDWGNRMATLRWNYLASDDLFANATLIYSSYQFDVGVGLEETFLTPDSVSTNRLSYDSGIRDLALRVDVDYLPRPDHSIRFGGAATHHRFTPGVGSFSESTSGARPQDETNVFTADSTGFDALEGYLYAEDDWRITDRLQANIGVHASAMAVEGTVYASLQPRLAARLRLSEEWSAKASFGTMQQYVHLLTNAGVGLPTDLWVAATDRIPPQRAWQAAAGLTHVRGEGLWEISVEGYYKRMRNLIEYQAGASFLNTGGNWEDKVTVGEGWSYGGEVFVQKTHGRTTGWLGYTLSRAERRFDDLNDGRAFPYRYDRTHDVSLVLSRALGKRWDLGATWVYGTGNAITLVTARFRGGENLWGSFPIYDHYGERGGVRMRAYHRADLSLRWQATGRSAWTLSFYNAYNRKNPYYYYGEDTYENGVNARRYKQISLFPTIPALTWSFSY
jgi:hypothetical protein